MFFFVPSNIDDIYFAGKTTVVVDVLRATSTIVTALYNGAKEVIPVDSTEFALKVSSSTFSGQTLTGGERNTKKIDGFHFGNSPLEYNPDNIKGKSIILFTTNGTKAIVKAKFSKNLYICSFLNLTSVSRLLASQESDIEIVCSGGSGYFCMEDTVCAGLLISEILKVNPDIELTDSARAGLLLAKSYESDLYKMLSECDHGKLLNDNGYQEDIKFCSNLNVYDVVPVFSANTIKIPAVDKNETAS